MQKSLINLLLAALISLVMDPLAEVAAVDQILRLLTILIIKIQLRVYREVSPRLELALTWTFILQHMMQRMIILHLVFQGNPTGRLLNHHLEGYMVFQETVILILHTL